MPDDYVVYRASAAVIGGFATMMAISIVLLLFRMSADDVGVDVLVWVGLGMAAVFGFLLALVVRAVTVVSGEGVAVRQLFGTRYHPWVEIADIRIARMSGTGVHSAVIYDAELRQVFLPQVTASCSARSGWNTSRRAAPPMDGRVRPGNTVGEGGGGGRTHRGEPQAVLDTPAHRPRDRPHGRTANAGPGCVVFHCAGGKDRTGLLALVLLTLAGATPDEIIADYLLTYDRMKQRYELGARDQLAAVSWLLTSHNTTIETSLTSTIASLTMPDFLLRDGLSDTELAALRTRLTA